MQSAQPGSSQLTSQLANPQVSTSLFPAEQVLQSYHGDIMQYLDFAPGTFPPHLPTWGASAQGPFPQAMSAFAPTSTLHFKPNLNLDSLRAATSMSKRAAGPSRGGDTFPTLGRPDDNHLRASSRTHIATAESRNLPSGSTGAASPLVWGSTTPSPLSQRLQDDMRILGPHLWGERGYLDENKVWHSFDG